MIVIRQAITCEITYNIEVISVKYKYNILAKSCSNPYSHHTTCISRPTEGRRMIAWHIVTSLQGRSVSGMRVCHVHRRHVCQRRDIPTRYAVLLTMLMLGLSFVVPVQAQISGSSTPLSSISGLTPPERATALAVETLCPKLNPNVTAGGVG